jgi:hypothetical protein
MAIDFSGIYLNRTFVVDFLFLVRNQSDRKQPASLMNKLLLHFNTKDIFEKMAEIFLFCSQEKNGCTEISASAEFVSLTLQIISYFSDNFSISMLY